MAVSSVKAKINGITYTLAYNAETGAYEGTVTAPVSSSFNQSGGYYDVEITAYDDSGNSAVANSSDLSFGDSLKLYVEEKVSPTITIVSPTDNAVLTNNKPTISWKCVDTDSGINTDTINLYIDGTEADGTISAVNNNGTYTCSYIPTKVLTDGTHTIKYEVYDNDGNAKTAQITVKVDTVAPTLTISQPENNIKVNKTPITVSGYTSDVTSSPVVLTVNDESVAVDANGYFTTAVDLVNGDNTITIKSTDSAGKSTIITRTVNFNNKPPIIEAVSIVPNPVEAGAVFKVSVVVTDE